MPVRILPRAIRLLTVLLFTTHASLGCGTEDDPPDVSTESLASMDAWSPSTAADDPYPEHRPKEVVCPTGSFLSEDIGGKLTFDVNTARCRYFSGKQKTLVDLRAGDQVAIRLFHYDLTATEPAKGHVALHLGGEELWSETVKIPAESELLKATVSVAKGVPKGTPLYYHVHNHGENTWSLLHVNRVRTE